ncbi:hypothetical protein IP92_03559 [Pseudoduganella flava]|uniref:Uncharacterized protein n=1 Tax=Pseudoduganella flava TaxID=871742 RepID=A0A562PNU9_9BURK|nr:hypothetical protein [Pseudoduganella flava]QGZ40672.1 hypothetical protein GO485_17450 [Pseudoduganella flava]TWI46125.1 hypothetical protein IP92_03559 [Pseudoduganella flava]
MTLSAWISKAPACAAALSALVYFATSDGIRNHVLLLARAARVLLEHSR